MGLPATREPPPKRTQEIRKLPKRTPDEIVRDWWINLSPQERAMEALSWVFPPSMGVLKIAGIPKGLIQLAKAKKSGLDFVTEFGEVLRVKPSSKRVAAMLEEAWQWPQKRWRNLEKFDVEIPRSAPSAGGEVSYPLNVPLAEKAQAAHMRLNPYHLASSPIGVRPWAKETAGHEFSHLLTAFPPPETTKASAKLFALHKVYQRFAPRLVNTESPIERLSYGIGRARAIGKMKPGSKALKRATGLFAMKSAYMDSLFKLRDELARMELSNPDLIADVEEAYRELELIARMPWE